MAKKTRRTKRGIRVFVDTWRERFAEDNVLTWASAISFQALVALVPLTLLLLGVLGALGERSVWQKQIRPGLQHRLQKPTFGAVDFSAQEVLHHASVGLLVFAIVLTIWEISGSVRAVGGALDDIYGTASDDRPLGLRWGISVAVAIVIGCCFLGAILLLTLAKHTGGSLQALLSVVRWFAALLLLGIAIQTLLRFAPTAPRANRWVSVGSAFIVVSWAIASVIFRWYVTSLASFKSVWGTFVAVLVLTAYLKISAIVFLVGAEADELVRKDATPGEKGLLGRVRAAFG